MGASPGDKPFRAVAFLLSLAGHRRARAASPVELHKRIRLMAKGVNTVLRTRKGLDYDPLDIIEFNSFDGLLGKRPPGGTVWQSIVIVTHAGGEGPAEFAGEIFLGDKSYFVASGGMNDLLDAINAKLNRVNQFRAQFDDPSNLTLIGCGVGAPGPDVAIYMRELFGTEGLIRYPIKNVDFFANGDAGHTEGPGEAESPPPPHGRRLERSWTGRTTSSTPSTRSCLTISRRRWTRGCWRRCGRVEARDYGPKCHDDNPIADIGPLGTIDSPAPAPQTRCADATQEPVHATVAAPPARNLGCVVRAIWHDLEVLLVGGSPSIRAASQRASLHLAHARGDHAPLGEQVHSHSSPSGSCGGRRAHELSDRLEDRPESMGHLVID